MMMWAGLYGVMALFVAMSFAAWDNGKRWDMNRYLFLGATWIISLPFTLGIVLIRKYLRGKAQ